MRYRFADCVLDTETMTLTRDGAVQKVEPQVFDLLHLLVRQAGRLVTRDEIVETVWRGRIVSESAISARIAAARKAVGDDGKWQRIIRTVSKRGLQMVVPVNSGGTAPPGASGSLPVPRVRYVTAVDGIRLAFAVSGEGTPVLRISHGMTHLQEEWTQPSDGPFLQKISQHHRLLRMDERNTVMSDPDDQAPSLEQTADHLRLVADAAGFERFAIYAESGGSFAALTFAARYPELVSRIIIIGGYVEGRLLRDGAGREEPLRALMAEGWDTPSSPLVSAMMTAYFPEGPHDVVRSMTAFSQRNSNRANGLQWRDMINRTSIAGLLDRIAAPTLIIHSQRDGVHPVSEARKLAGGIRNSELLVYDSANHLPLPGHALWDRFLEDFLGFLGEPDPEGA